MSAAPELELVDRSCAGVVTARHLFHASPTRFDRGEPLLPGSRTGHLTVGEGRYVHLACSVEDARAWGRYIGQRLNLDEVFIYEVLPIQIVGERADARGRLPRPEVWAQGAHVVDTCGTVDPWEGLSADVRASWAAAPF